MDPYKVKYIFLYVRCIIIHNQYYVFVKSIVEPERNQFQLHIIIFIVIIWCSYDIHTLL